MKLPKPILDLVDMINAGPGRSTTGVMGVYYYVDDVAEAVRALRAERPPRRARVLAGAVSRDRAARSTRGQSIVRWVTAGRRPVRDHRRLRAVHLLGRVVADRWWEARS